MAKYSINSTKQEPFKPKFGTKDVILEAVTNTENKIISFAITIKNKVKNFSVTKGAIRKAWTEVENNFPNLKSK